MNENNHDTPLYNLNPLTRFSDKAENYTKYRPVYPDAVIDQILENFTLPITAADIGAGTGISARQLASRGVNVIAIEPNAAMRNAASNHQGIEWKNGTAENTNLPEASVDLITCFQAFHWFKPEPTLLEFRRILKSKGRLAIVFQDLNRDDEFTQIYGELTSKAANNRPPTDFSSKIEPLRKSRDFQYIDCYQFRDKQQLHLSSLIGLVKSISFISSEERVQKQLINDLETLHQRFCNSDGFVYLVYCNSVHLANIS
ncbi:class I SAM-dependent methyltransferase [Plectonema cf. radiosum LEGE 06105]|uniref:Class I SAM-dependent methyltransferase n=1 Tax=Plectonema cf. radiosum LEGE 06105 TaxID=945769 RepID=A0A8J7F1E8_9CYAN|nr:class I SAM-dependent methyltransferase [Plectonema radiosum]MBE9214243.1 class I SAM-dependent methyltransferase [Plectonema cf. radiosum LEGE 06105]